MYRNRFLEGYSQFADPVGTVEKILGDAYSYQPIVGLTGTGRPWYGGNDPSEDTERIPGTRIPGTKTEGGVGEGLADSNTFGLTPGEEASVSPMNIGKFAVDSLRFGFVPHPMAVPMIGLSFARNILGWRPENLFNPEMQVIPAPVVNFPVEPNTFNTFGRMPSFTNTQSFSDLAADLGVDVGGIDAAGYGGYGGGGGMGMGDGGYGDAGTSSSTGADAGAPGGSPGDGGSAAGIA